MIGIDAGAAGLYKREYDKGLTGVSNRREQIAVRVLVALLGSPDEMQGISGLAQEEGRDSAEVLAGTAVRVADALLARLAQP